MPTWVYQRNSAPAAAGQPQEAERPAGPSARAKPDAGHAAPPARVVRLLSRTDHDASRHPPAEPPLPAVCAPAVAAEAPPASAPAADALLLSDDELPAYERVFGTGPRDPDFKDGVKSGVAGLVHADGTATVLVARGHQYIAETFKDMLVRGGLQPLAPVRQSTSDFILTLYRNATAANDRRRAYDNASTPAEAQKVLQAILDQALQQGASDIDVHVLGAAQPPRSTVYFRVHGTFLAQDRLLSDPNIAHSVMRAAYTGDYADSQSRSHTNFNTVEGMYATLQVPGLRNLRLRLQTIPHVLGYGVNLRVLSHDGMDGQFTTLQALGFSEEHERDIVDAFSTERGGLLLFIAGTGEGKTRTLMTAIPMDRRFGMRKWVSIEDPVEIIDARIFQSPVRRNTSRQDDVAEHVAAMSNTLRFDPDGINAGEIRDAITAKLAERSAMTGHVTAATLHGTDPFTAFHRLIDLGARKVNLLDGVARMFCHQKLVQTLCPHCATPASRSTPREHRLFLQELDKAYGVDTAKVRLRGPGCDACYPAGHPLAGVLGRTVVAEVVRFNQDILRALRASDDTQAARRAWRSQRVAEYHEPGTLGKTIGEHALYKLLHGLISPDTYLGIAGAFEEQEPLPIHGRERRPA